MSDCGISDKRKRALALFIGLAVGAWPLGHAHAQGVTVQFGNVVEVFADPSDMVAALDVKGRCGSNFFHAQRSAANFKELSAVMLMAFSTTKRVHFFVKSCAGDRNILSHGAVMSP